MKSARIVMVVAAGVVLAVAPTDLDSCGPFLPQAVFVNREGPPNPLDGLAEGKLGVLQPEYRTAYLVVAYRYLTGQDLDRREASQLFPPRTEAVRFEDPSRVKSGLELWTDTRARIFSLPSVNINSYRSIHRGDMYSGFDNCLADAFNTAAKTLEARAAAWGPASPWLKDWLAAQDVVFENCSGENESEPAVAPAGAPGLLLADRQYQSAAAAFYAGNWDKARTAFRLVDADRSSPWHEYAAYLIARTDLRQGTIDDNKEALERARAELIAIRDNPASTPRDKAAAGLLQFLELRREPDAKLRELSQALTRPRLAGDPRQEITDFLYLYWNRDKTAPRVTSGVNDLIAWLGFWKAPHAKDTPDPVARWREGGGLAWLIAALYDADEQDSAGPDLLKAARPVPRDSPAYLSVAYYAARLEVLRGDKDAAREWDERALAQPLSDQERNRFLAQRLTLARNWAEFLRYSPRKTNLATYTGYDLETVGGDVLKDANAGPAFDDDTVGDWNLRIPLRLWIDAAKGTILPESLRLQLARSGWVRAVVLDRPDDATALLGVWKLLDPRGAAAASGYSSAPDAQSARIAATLILLRNPGLEPVVRSGFGRLLRNELRDPWRDNWWCFAPDPPSPSPKESPRPLGSADSAQGEREKAQLRDAGGGARYLTARTIAWAKERPHDPFVPEGLALALEAIHYGGCQDARQAAVSEQAFNILKRQYPNSGWAKKTKYWYK